MDGAASPFRAPVIALDGPDKVTGAARYTFDVSLPGMLHAKVLRSPHPHARIRSDTGRAEGLPGVAAVVTGIDAVGLPDPYYGVAIRDQPVVAIDKVRYVGDMAEAALKRAVFQKCALDRVEAAAFRQSLDRNYRLAVDLKGKGGTGCHWHFIDEHRASAADRLVAADLAAEKLQILAEDIRQHSARSDVEPMGSAIDRDGNLDRLGHAAALKLRRISTSIMRRR